MHTSAFQPIPMPSEVPQLYSLKWILYHKDVCVLGDFSTYWMWVWHSYVVGVSVMGILSLS